MNCEVELGAHSLGLVDALHEKLFGRCGLVQFVLLLLDTNDFVGLHFYFLGVVINFHGADFDLLPDGCGPTESMIPANTLPPEMQQLVEPDNRGGEAEDPYPDGDFLYTDDGDMPGYNEMQRERKGALKRDLEDDAAAMEAGRQAHSFMPRCLAAKLKGCLQLRT